MTTQHTPLRSRLLDHGVTAAWDNCECLALVDKAERDRNALLAAAEAIWAARHPGQSQKEYEALEQLRAAIKQAKEGAA